MDETEQHEHLIEAGLELHESRRYAEALPYFERSFASTPNCVAAKYNLANTLHMLDRDHEASSILLELLETSNETFLTGCPLQEDPRPFKLDALFLLFLTTLSDTENWEMAYRFAQQHLESRSDDVDSVWSNKDVQTQIESLKCEYESE
jgi:tetratricopeptide (TPR) repeat protein